MAGGRNPGTRDAKAIYGAKEINAVEDDSRCQWGVTEVGEATEGGEMFG